MGESAGVGVLGVGTALPSILRTNDFWDGRLRSRVDDVRKDIFVLETSAKGESRALPAAVAEAMALFEGDPFRGARRRYVLAEDREISDLEAEAVRKALQSANVRPDEIDLLLIHSVVQDDVHPTNGPAVVHKCELVNATAWDLDVACASLMGAMTAATALIRSGMYRRIAIVCSAVWSRIIDYETVQSVSFGDGAAALIMGAVPAGYGVIGHWSRTDGSLRDGVVVAPVVDGKPQHRWDRGGGPFRLGTRNVEMGKYLGTNAPRFCHEACTNALSAAGVSLGDVGLFLGGQTLGWFVDGCRRALGLSREKAPDSFAEVGNIGAAALIYNLERALEQKRLEDGDIVLMYSPGAGFTRASVVYRWYAGQP